MQWRIILIWECGRNRLISRVYVITSHGELARCIVADMNSIPLSRSEVHLGALGYPYDTADTLSLLGMYVHTGHYYGKHALLNARRFNCLFSLATVHRTFVTVS